MGKTIFALSRTTGGKLFDSYIDYHRMIEMWNYPTCELNEIDYESDNTYIYSSPIGIPQQVFFHDAAKNRKCKLVMIFLEWPKWENGELLHLKGLADPVDEVWVCDKHLYDLWQMFEPQTINKVRFMVMGGHPDFGVKPQDRKKSDYEWDCVHLMYLTGMRGFKFHVMRDEIGYSMAPTTYNDEARRNTLLNSEFGLNLHQNPLPCISPQRFMVFASYCLPIITDFCENPYPYHVFNDALIHFDPRKTSVSNELLRNTATEYNRYMVTVKHNFKAEVERLTNG